MVSFKEEMGRGERCRLLKIEKKSGDMGHLDGLQGVMLFYDGGGRRKVTTTGASEKARERVSFLSFINPSSQLGGFPPKRQE